MSMIDTIKKLSEKRGKSVRQVAFDLGISENYLYRLKGDKIPTGTILEKLADYFHVSVDYLLGREEKESELTIDEAIDHAMSFDGKPISDHDREVIRGIVDAYLRKSHDLED